MSEEKNCYHAASIAMLQQRDADIMHEIQEIKADIKTILAALETTRLLQQDFLYHKESISRLFNRIELIEKKQMDIDAKFQRFEGMKNFAVILWTVLSSGIGILVLKSFGVI